jgi:hypothetical protein
MRAARPGAGLLSLALIAGLYLPTLSARFDFADDGNLVYPAPRLALPERVQLMWTKVVANYDHLGPFRPVLWAHWEVEADVLGADALSWRLVRLAWMALATAVMLGLLGELRIAPSAAFCATALAMWSPAANEVWRSLTLSEGVAMPYALGALVCALRAGRSSRPWPWDVAGIACALAALGCKNTFAAIVPAQLLLRVAPDGPLLVQAVRARGARAALLALPLLLPLAHFAVFLRDWHPGQYTPGPPSSRQLRRMLGTVQTGASLALVGPGVIAAVAALTVGRMPAGVRSGLGGWARAAGRVARECWTRHRAAARAGVALLLAGIGVYLPLQNVSARYAIPAVWGVELLIAALLSELARTAPAAGKRIAIILLGCGLAVLAVDNLLRQDKWAARSAMLWEALELVERRAEPGAVVAWQSGDVLGIAEGIHFYWHLHGRGRGDLGMQLFAPDGVVVQRSEVPPAAGLPTLLVSTATEPPANWTLLQAFDHRYRWGLGSHRCSVWTRGGAT